MQSLFSFEDHPMVMAGDGGTYTGGALALNTWIYPWLWKCLSLLGANEPAEMVKNFLKYLLVFLTAHKF